MPMYCGLLLALTLVAQPTVSEDVLEPSVRNEVDHALAVAPTGSVATAVAPRLFAETFATNGLSATALAVKLVSAQRSDGRWYAGTNDVTAVAVEVLEGL